MSNTDLKQISDKLDLIQSTLAEIKERIDQCDHLSEEEILALREGRADYAAGKTKRL